MLFPATPTETTFCPEPLTCGAAPTSPQFAGTKVSATCSLKPELAGQDKLRTLFSLLMVSAGTLTPVVDKVTVLLAGLRSV